MNRIHYNGTHKNNTNFLVVRAFSNRSVGVTICIIVSTIVVGMSHVCGSIRATRYLCEY